MQKEHGKDSCPNFPSRCRNPGCANLSQGISQPHFPPPFSLSPCTRPPSLGFPASRGLTGVFSRRAGLLHSRHGLGDRRLSRFNLQDKHPGAGACSVLSPGTRRSRARLRALPTPPGVPPRLRAREVPQLCSRAGLELGGRKFPLREPLGGFLRNGSSWSFHGPDGWGERVEDEYQNTKCDPECGSRC